MRSIVKALLFLVLIVLVGFTLVINEDEVPTLPTTDAEEISLETKLPNFDPGLIDYIDLGTMKASWYGPGFHGRKTANGEKFDQMSYTAAHKNLKFGTLLKVTNPINGKSIVVRINDRGPYIEGRDLDLSKAAAHELGLMRRGIAKLKVEKLEISGLDEMVTN
ncbi:MULTISPECIES: septal ring lytic transglycosylase RlpA family protein [Ignavibacterium]|uniref:septal ring lytic transglycosylase RlpA family protein n=1 Tax=Ignavibacterium TaxID=795750 RepID=UPI0025C257D1|nr:MULTISPECIES: septal ring lytic transglycosylase RlpA family protein [Ignavibacterium]MBI5662497.1 septal ring lytic transglycosylase RlpA family protein [Ignavibacterium album]